MTQTNRALFFGWSTILTDRRKLWHSKAAKARGLPGHVYIYKHKLRTDAAQGIALDIVQR